MNARTDLILLLLVLIGLQAGLLILAKAERKPDFAAFYTAAQIVRQGNGARLYDLEFQKQVQGSVAGASDLFLPFYYPAFLVLLLYPLSYLPYEIAYSAWMVFCFVLLLGTALIPLRLNLPADKTIRVMLVLAFPPALFCLLLGQMGAVMLFVFASALSLWHAERPGLAGVVLGIAFIKFQHLLPFLMILFLKKQWNVLQGVLLTGCVLLVVWVSITGWSGLSAYAVLILHFLNSSRAENVAFGLSAEMMPTARGFLSLLITSRATLLVSTVAASAGLIWVAVRFWKRDQLSLSFAVALVASFLCSFHGNIADLTLLLLPIMILSAQPQTWWTHASLALLYFPLLYLVLLHYRLSALFLPATALLLFTLTRSGDLAARQRIRVNSGILFRKSAW